MVIFGAAGDLTARMLIPALYNLARANLLSKEFAVLGVARTQMSDEDFRKSVYDDVKEYCGDCIEDSHVGVASRAAFIILPAISKTTNFIRN
jgi:glucose-6-phosphate 1-dehydrogenase